MAAALMKSDGRGNGTSINSATEQHVRKFFKGHPIAPRQWSDTRAREALPRLEVLEIGSGPRLFQWTYVTVGAWEANDANPFEYLMTADEPRHEYVKLLTVTACYAIEHHLGLGHTIPIGRPLVSGSECEHVYLSLPYPFGPKLEIVPLGDKERRILWLFPITGPEKELLVSEGSDALEDRLEAAQVEYWNPHRESVV